MVYWLYYKLKVINRNFMENNINPNKNLWIGGGVALVVVVGFIFWSMNSSAPTTSPATVDNQVTPAPSSSTEDTSTGSVNVGAPAASISYQNALIKYKNARLQLDTICQANPNRMAFKNNALLMIDNRSPVDRVVKVGYTFNIRAYGFKIVKLSSATLPATWLVDCDKSQNVATLVIQK